MSRKQFIVYIFVTLLAASTHADEAAQTKALLLERNQEFQQDVIRVSDRVYTAVGFGLSPVSMIIGDTGLVIVDATIDLPSGNKVLAEFRKLSDKPIKALVFTHSHADHTGGAQAFLQEGTEVWARAPFNTEQSSFDEAGLTIIQSRGFRQFGRLAPEAGIEHVGIGARYVPPTQAGPPAKPVSPSHTFSDAEQALNVAGLELKLFAASGETSDQLFVWFEQERVVFAGDNFYKSWPNLYAIRGTPYRDVKAWIASLTSMLNKQPHRLVGGHTRPIIGETKVSEVLTNYRDAVKFLFDKTIEGMNKGLTPDELVEYVVLPEKFKNLDYLRPYYGHPEWSVRSIFTGYLGWFDGNPTSLFPLGPDEEAHRMAALAGGREALQRAMVEALQAGQHQWALQLVDYLLQLSPNDRSLLLRKADLLETMAEQYLNVTARNYFRSYACELRQKAGS